VVDQNLINFGRKYLGFLVDLYFPLFQDLDKELKKAALPITVYEFAAYAVTLAIIVALPLSIILALALFFIGSFFKIKILTFPPIIIVAFVVFFFIIFHFVLMLLTAYPSIIASQRKSSIEKNLPYV
jgi:pilus assembly protein TadC